MGLTRTQIFLLLFQVLAFMPVIAYLGWHLWRARKAQRKYPTYAEIKEAQRVLGEKYSGLERLGG